MGQEDIVKYTPSTIGNTVFSTLPGQTAKLTSLSRNLEAVLPHNITRKCVVAEYNSLLPSLIVTALVNTVETD